MNSFELIKDQFLLKRTSIFIFHLVLLLAITGQMEGLAQVQLDVQGRVDSDDTVAVIKVNSNAMFSDVIGLNVFSHPAPGRGIGGSFYGGNIGVKAESRQTALFGKSQNTWGVFAESDFGSAGYFKSGPGKMDIVFGGSEYGGSANNDEGVIGMSGSLPSGDLHFISNDAVLVQLDNDDDESGHFIIKNGDQESAISINESGYITFKDGSVQTSAPYRTRYELKEVGSTTTYNLTTANVWVPLGDLVTINKDRDDTHLELTFDGLGRGIAATIGSVIQFAIRIDGNAGEIELSHHKVGTGGNSFTMDLLSVFSSLTAGAHTMQIYARTYNDVPAVAVQVPITYRRVFIKETY